MTEFVEQAVEAVAFVTAELMVEEHGSWLVARLGCADCWSCVGSFSLVVDSLMVLVAFRLMKATTVFVVLVNEDHVRSSLDLEDLLACDSCHAASDNSTDLTPQPLPWRLLG